MARKIDTNKVKEKMSKLQVKIDKAQTELNTLQAAYDELAEQLKQVETEQLLEIIKETGLTLDQVREQLTQKKEG